MSLSRMSSIEYLTRSIAVGDGRWPDPTTPLTRYYTADGYPPGQWLGSGLTGLAAIRAGDEVTEADLRSLFQDATDPTTGARLGRPVPTYPSRSERIARRVAALPDKLPPSTRQQLIEAITAQERATPSRHAVAGFDLTFSVPKSVSALWAIADHGTQVKLYDAHRAAMHTVLDLIEVEALRTRVGAQGVGRVVTRGTVAAAFDHWDSRKGDPQLHTHVTAANHVQGKDGVWRTIDSRTLYRSVVAYSETYNALLADEITRRTGLTWQQRERGRGRRTARELAIVPQDLIAAFSQRSADIEQAVDEAVDEYRSRHGRRPPTRVLNRIRQHVTLETRTPKQHGSLANAVQEWRERASAVLHTDPDRWVQQAIATGQASRAVMVRADDIPVTDTTAMAAAVIAEVSNSRATWSRWNITAETIRQVAAAGWQFADPEDLLAIRDRIVDAAEQLSVSITAPELAVTPATFRDRTGASIFRRPTVFTSQAVLAAEDALLALATDTTGPAVDVEQAHRIAEQPLPGRTEVLSPDDQAPAAVTVAMSGRRVDVLVGPAGTGKTTTLAGVRAMWEAQHGPGSVVGLAPSARAAQVLAEELGIETDNTAQWLAQQTRQADRAHAIEVLTTRATSTNEPALRHADIAEQQRTFDRWNLHPGQLLIVDEAGMAGTFALHRLAQQAADSGAKLLLVGDPYQLSAVETGGAFGLLAAARADTPVLSEIRRFVEPDGTVREWEQCAADALRIGDESAADTYAAHGRLRSGSRGEATEAAYRSWLADTAAGRMSILVAADNDTVHELNERARADLVTAGTVTDDDAVTLHDGLRAGRGDRIVTRAIDRYLPDGTTTQSNGKQRTGFVRNGQQWLVDRARRDGSLTVRLLDPAGLPSAARVTLPADYVRQHVELAYATTAHRAQGVTVDTAHVVADAATTREVFYVAMTRGRGANTAYLVLDATRGGADADQHRIGGDEEPWTAREVMHAIVTNVGREASAHETSRDEQDAAGSIAQLAAEAETIAAYAHRAATAEMVRAAAGTDAMAARVVNDPHFADLVAATRSAHLARLDPRQVIGSIDDANDAPALADRIRAATRSVTNLRHPRRRMIAGIIPDATPGLADPQMLTALRQRYHLIERRADAVVDRALENREPWIRPLLAHQHATTRDLQWRQATRMIAAYRDRWQITTSSPLGPLTDRSTSYSQQADYRRAALARASLSAAADHSAPQAERSAGHTL